MKKFQIVRSVQDASGHQIFEVEANSKEEAAEKFRNGEGDFVSEEVEVTSLSPINEREIEEVES